MQSSPPTGPAPSFKRVVQVVAAASGVLLLEEILRVWTPGNTPNTDNVALIAAAVAGLVASAAAAVIARVRAAAASANAVVGAAAAAIDFAALQTVALTPIMAAPLPSLPPLPSLTPLPPPAAAVVCIHDKVCSCIAAVLGPAYVDTCFKAGPAGPAGPAAPAGPRLMSGNRRALVASISGFLADMTALAGDPRHITVFVSHGSTGPTSNVLQLQCQIRAGTPLPPLSPPSPHWAAVETCFLCSAARRVCGAISKSKPQTAATLSGDYTLNLGPELRMWRHGPAAAQHQRALLAWSAVVVVDDDVTMHRWFQRYFVKTAPVAPTALHTFGDTGTFLAAAQTAQGPTSRLFDGSVLLFLDLVLPDGDGRDLCHHLRTACRSEAFVVAMTGLPSSDPTATDAHLANAGFDAVLRKPLQSAVVQALLRRCTC